MGKLIPPPGMTEEELTELLEPGSVLLPIEGRPNHFWNAQSGRPVVARADQTEADILAALAEAENLTPPEPTRDLQAELDALKAVLIKEDPTRADKIEEETAILEVALPMEK